MKDSLLIDFFLTIGLPKCLVIDVLKAVENECDGDFTSAKTFTHVERMIKGHPSVMKTSSDMILSLYPDCKSSKMPDDDPRKNYLDKDKIRQLAQYGFPVGFKPIRSSRRPKNELIPNIFCAGQEKTCMQYLVFYESLEEHYQKAYTLFKNVLTEIDERQFGLEDVEGLEDLRDDDEESVSTNDMSIHMGSEETKQSDVVRSGDLFGSVHTTKPDFEDDPGFKDSVALPNTRERFSTK